MSGVVIGRCGLNCFCLHHYLYRQDTDIPFSPPGHDDSFFYIRYPSGSAKNAEAPLAGVSGQEKLSIADQIRVATGNAPVGNITAAVKGMNLDAKSKVDLSKLTEPCRQYLAGENGE